MLNRLIRWLAADAMAALRAELAEIKATLDQTVAIAYANGYNAGRVVGHGEMLAHLRGDPAERATTDMIRRRAAEMVH